MSYDLRLEASAVPLNRRNRVFKRFLFRRLKEEAFLVGEDFEVTYMVTNVDSRHFPGGVLQIVISWPNGQGESSPYVVPSLAPGDPHTIHIARWGVLANGFSLFSARMHENARLVRYKIVGSVGDSRLFRDEGRRHRIFPNVSFFSVYGQNPEEFYELWGMMIAAFGFLILVLFGNVPNLIDFIQWLITSFYP